MERIRLNIFGLSSGQSNGSYTLILSEENGKRKLPIIIGSFEAQAIAIEIEKIVPFRPMTHDLFVSFCKTFNITISEIEIYNLVEGVFHAKLICDKDGDAYEIDARTSDSIALAVRFKCPIFTFEDIMESAGVVFNDEIEEELEIPKPKESEFSSLSADKLNQMLEDALRNEDYIKAAQIRDEIKNRKK